MTSTYSNHGYVYGTNHLLRYKKVVHAFGRAQGGGSTHFVVLSLQMVSSRASPTLHFIVMTSMGNMVE